MERSPRRDRHPDGATLHDAPTLEDLLDRVGETADPRERTSIGDVLEAVGNRSFGPLLLLPGLVILAPLVGDIPGVPVLMGVVIALTGAQLFVRRDHVWLPRWLLVRSVSRDKLCTALRWLRPLARFLDRWSRPRLTFLIHGPGLRLVAAACVGTAAATPVMEFVPFSANFAGVAISAFGLALVAEDGLLALLALAFSAGGATLLVTALV